MQKYQYNLPASSALCLTVFKALLLFMVITLGGCSMLGKPVEPPAPEVITIKVPPAPVEPAVVEPEPEPVTKPVPLPIPVPEIVIEKPVSLDVAIIISRDIENYHHLSNEIGRLITLKGGTFEPLYLYQQGAAEIIQQIKHEQRQQVVAIGLEAAKAAKMLQQIPVVFCQIYNYQDYNLVTEHLKGVSLIPSVDQQFKAWKEIVPELKQVGVIVGDGKQPIIEQATQSAAAHGIALISRAVKNDKEMWEEFRRLIPQVDGFWLLPDNRILSKRTLRNIVPYSVKHTTPLFTVNGLLLQDGAMISAAQVDSDIAEKVVTRLLATAPDNTIPGADIVPLELAHIIINTHTAKRFNLLIPNDNTEINIERWPSSEDSATLTQ